MYAFITRSWRPAAMFSSASLAMRYLPFGCWLSLPLLVMAGACQAADAVTLGVFAYRPKPAMLLRFQPLADYLGAELKDVRIDLRVLDQDEMEAALARGELDLVFTNPSHYLVVRSQNRLTGALATVVSMEDRRATSSLGGVIITGAWRTTIKTLRDLEGKRIAVPGTKYLGGYQTQAFELLEAGIRLPGDAELSIVGKHDDVVAAVLSGRAEAGFIRTGVIENMAAEGRLDPNRLRVINSMSHADFPYRVSTRLYPEWPFLALPQVDKRTVRRVAAALLTLEPDHPAARAARIAGFAPPADYLVVETLARSLRLPPFDSAPEITPADIWRKYQAWILALGLVTLLLFLMVTRFVLLHRRVVEGRKVMERMLAEQSAMLENELIGIVRVRDRVIQWANPAFEQMLGYARGELLGVPTRRNYPDEASYQALGEAAYRRLAEGKLFRSRIEHVRKDGRHIWVDISGGMLDRKTGESLWAFIDISEQKKAEDSLRLAASVFSHAREGIMITSADAEIIDVNEAFCRITGYTREEVVGRNPRILASGRQGREYYASMWRELLEQGHWYGEVWNRRKNGEVFAMMQTISAVRDASGKVRRYLSLFSDITSLKEHERQLEQIAHYDALTGLPNRLLLADRLHQAMAQAQRYGQLLGVAYLDLDGFKAVNDSHGHAVGDQLLIVLASRMKHALREGDTIARIGGDEFVAVITNLKDAESCDPTLVRLLAAASQAVPVGEMTLRVSVSIGVSYFPRGAETDAETLLRQADEAMYQAKLAGRNRCEVYAAGAAD